MTEAERERAAVLTWLRKLSNHRREDWGAIANAADAIERGEHLPAGE